MRKKTVAKKPTAQKPPNKATAKKPAAKTRTAALKKPTVHEPIKMFTRGEGKTAKNQVRPPTISSAGTSLADRRRIGSQMAASFLTEEWPKVTLSARKTYSPRAQLVLLNPELLDAEVPTIIFGIAEAFGTYAGVKFDAPRAGDYYLIEFFITVIQRDSEYELRTSGSASQNLKLAAGPHVLRVVAVPKTKGQQSVTLWATDEALGFYLDRIEIQPMKS